MGAHSLEMASGGTSQDTERIRSCEGHSHSGDGIGRDKSGHEKIRPGDGCSLSGDGIGRDKSAHRRIGPSEVHSLPGDGIGKDNQDTERIRSSEVHSLSGDSIERDKSGHKKSSSEQWALTLWSRHREGEVRTRKESDRARGTHFLETASGRTSQCTETMRPSEWHSLPGDSIGSDKSEHGKNLTEPWALTYWRRHRKR